MSCECAGNCEDFLATLKLEFVWADATTSDARSGAGQLCSDAR